MNHLKREPYPEYSWAGSWQGPGHGKYVVLCNGKELEPGEVIDLLDKYEDLLIQCSHKPGSENETLI